MRVPNDGLVLVGHQVHRGSRLVGLLESVDVNRWPSFLPHPAVLTVGLIWGMNFVFLQIAFKEFDQSVLAVLRFLILLPLMLAFAKLSKQEAKLPREHWLRVCIGGFLNSGIYMVLFFEGASRVSASEGAIVMSTVPIWIAVLAMVSRQEKFRGGVFLGLIVAYSGVAIVILFGATHFEGTLTGIGFILAAALTWATSVITLNPVLKDHPAVGVFALSLLPAGIALLPWGGMKTLQMDYGSVTIAGWFSLAYLILGAGLAGFALYYVAIKAVGPSQAAIIQYIVPVVATIGQYFILKQPIQFLQIVGMFIVLAGVIFAKWAGREPRASDLSVKTG